MTETPLQRAAKALAAELSAGEKSPGEWFIEGGLYSDAMLQDIARAVLQAIREPSEAMLKAGYLQEDEENGTRAIYQTMIDAALSD